MSPALWRRSSRRILLWAPIIVSTITSLPAAILTGGPRAAALTDTPWETVKLSFTQPEPVDNAYGNPIGNGHIAAKIKGGVETEVFALNNKSFWSSWPLDQRDPARRTAMLDTRRLLAAGDIPGAEQSARGMWGPLEPATYLPLGNLQVHFDHGAAHTGYTRDLNLDSALSTVRYTIGDVTYTREAFASFPDKVIVLRLTASQPGRLTFTTRLVNPPEMGAHGTTEIAGDDTLVMRSHAPAIDLKTWDKHKGMRHETRLRLTVGGGRIAPLGTDSLRVEGADSALFILADATSYAGFDKEPGTQGRDPSPVVTEMIGHVAAKSYEQLLESHLRDYRALFRRVWAEINGASTHPHAIGFQYARYEMIAVSRDGDRPHNQQGMWSHLWKPHSNCCHFLNENVQKYYSLIEAANIAECGEPLWNWMDQLAASGRKTAQTDWGFNGWLAPHSSDIWASTTLKGGNNEWAIWPMGGIWLCQHLWDHYAFGLDQKFLRERAYPLMKGACEFALDYLVEDDRGRLVTSPSTSPENRFGLKEGGQAYALSVGSTIDMALIRELFQNTVAASKILSIDPEFRARLETTLPRLLPFQIGANGELQEWSGDYSRLPADPRKRFTPHRHTSHVVSVWPLSQITERGTPELFEAAKLALKNRGRAGNHPDKAPMWARLKDGDRALASEDNFYTGRQLVGTWPGKYSAFAEMLVQSHAGEIELLPAVPSAWKKSGRIHGLRARGGYTLSLAWEDGRLTRCEIDSATGAIPTVRYAGEVLDLRADPRVTLTLP